MQFDESGYLRVDLLGRCAFRFQGRNLAPKSKKAAALFVYLLAKSPRPQLRSDLAPLLWPQANDKSARLSLRQALFELNKGFEHLNEAPIEATTDEVWVSGRGVHFAHDSVVEELRAVSDITDLADAVTKSADILPGLSDIGDDIDAWLAGFREDCFQQLQDKLEARLQQEVVGSPFCLALAKYLYQLAPYNEFALRVLMQSHDKIGESPTAIRLYDRHYQMLDTELSVEPSLETQDLAVAIKSKVLETPVTSATRARAEDSMSLLAVLPFDVAVQVENRELVSLAILEELTCLLSSLSAPAVISSNSTRFFSSTAQDANAFGKSLGADFVLSGRVHGLEDQLRIVVELSDTTNKRIVFARSYMTEQSDIFRTLPEVSERIVKHIVPSLHAEELAKIKNWSARSLEANHLYLRARQLMEHASQPAAEEAIGLLTGAVEKDADHAPSHTLLAEWAFLAQQQGWVTDSNVSFDEIERLALRACNLSANEARARAMLGHIQWTVRRDKRTAKDYIEDALETLPNDAETMIWSVPSLAFLGTPDRAVEIGERALSLSPIDPFRFRNQHFLAIAYYAQGAFDQAADTGAQSLIEAPTYLSNLRLTIAATAAQQDKSKLAGLVAQHNALCPEFDLENYAGIQAFNDPEVRDDFRRHLAAAFGA